MKERKGSRYCFMKPIYKGRVRTVISESKVADFELNVVQKIARSTMFVMFW